MSTEPVPQAGVSPGDTVLVGARVPRKEDGPLLNGRGTYVDNMQLPGMLHMVVVRSPYPNAEITSIDAEAAGCADGVVAVFTGAELMDDWKTPLPDIWPVTDEMLEPPHYPLAVEAARYVGDGVAVVVAESRTLARDAAELIEIEWNPLPSVGGLLDALEPDAALVHPELGTNECYVWRLETDGVEESIAGADVVVTRRYVQPRLIPSAMEPRSVVSAWDYIGNVTVWSSTQIPHLLRVYVSEMLGLRETEVRVIAPDVGGGFGSKCDVYAEEMLVVALSRRLGRPVKWTEERSENAVATIHARDVVTDMTVASTRDGRIVAVKADVKANMGAYLQLFTASVPLLGARIYGGTYVVPNYKITITGVFTNTTPTDAYRGAGRPEATYVIERSMEELAREVGLDSLELRRRNFITEFPAQLASGPIIDSGDYHAALDRLLELVDLKAVRRDQQERRARGDVMQLGIGFSTYNEMCGLAPSRISGEGGYRAGGWEAATIRYLPTGSVQVITGTSPHGQSHETVWAQIVADRLGCRIDEVDVLHGDTSVSSLGLDTYGSRSVAIGGPALWYAAEKLIDKARELVAHQLEAAPEDLDFQNGVFSVKGSPDRSMTLRAAARAAWDAHDLPDGMEPGMETHSVFDPTHFSWPGGAHAAIVEVDTATGDTRVVRYVAVDDVGRIMNPMVVEGQLHGALTQGIAAALYEEAAYDEEGYLQNGNFATYLVPSAAEMPSYELAFTTTESPSNPLGVKGAGETGTIASPPAVMNAVHDALEHLEVGDIQMPATPERVWRALQDAADRRVASE